MNIDYDKWAEDLLLEIYYAPDNLRCELIKEHLIKAAKRGYTDGADNDWWKEFDGESA
jgi:hypothetical protein